MVTQKIHSCNGKEHAHLASLLDKLSEMEEQSIGKEQFVVVIARLIRQAHLYFIAEEKLFEEFGYADTVAHKREHRELLRYLDRYYLQFQAGKIKTVSPLKEYLEKWVASHFLNMDKVFWTFMKQKELVPIYS